jgi:hypothetical protein
MPVADNFEELVIIVDVGQDVLPRDTRLVYKFND